MYLTLKLFYWEIKSFISRWLNFNISPKSYLAHDVQLLGKRNIKIEKNVTVGQRSLLTVNNRSNNDISLHIKSNVYIGRDNFFTVGKLIVISQYVIIGNNCSFLCSDHKFDTPLIPYSQSGESYTKSIIIGVNCWIGNNVSIVGNVKIGHGSVIGANSVVLNDIPPFSLAYGNPSRVVKRFDFTINDWVKIDNFKSIESEFYNEDIYLEYLTKNFNDIEIAYHSSSSKFKDL